MPFDLARRETTVAAALAVLGTLLAIAAPEFFRPANLRDLLLDNATLLIVAVGMTLVILAREIDISVGSQFAVLGVVTGLLSKLGLPMVAVLPAVLFCGAALGAANGLLVAAGLPSIVVTLATMTILREGLRWATQGEDVLGLPASFQWLGLSQGAGRTAIVLSALAILAAFAFIRRHVAAGRAVYAVGSDAEAARLLGLRPRRVVLGVFVTLGVLTALASVLAAVRFPQVQTGAGLGLELKVIAAVVVGGTAVSGGRGSLFGTLLGIVLLGSLGPALTFLKVSAFWEQALQGLIILGAVALEGFRRSSLISAAPRRPRTA